MSVLRREQRAGRWRASDDRSPAGRYHPMVALLFDGVDTPEARNNGALANLERTGAAADHRLAAGDVLERPTCQAAALARRRAPERPGQFGRDRGFDLLNTLADGGDVAPVFCPI